MKLIEEIYKTIADALKLPVWEIQSINLNDLNTALESAKMPCVAWLFDQPFTLESDLMGSQIYSRYQTRVYILALPSDELPDSLLATKKQLAEMAGQFRQILQKQEEYKVVPGNGSITLPLNFSYPQFDAKLMSVSIDLNVLLDMNVTVCVP